jgi:hypothetical protein
MTASQKKLLIRIVAAVVIVAIVALVAVVGHAPVVIVAAFSLGLLTGGLMALRAKRRTEIILRFYVAADEVLRADERRPYRFEVADVIKTGEKVVRQMPDPPPLSRFALGALYNSIGDYNGAVEQLGFAAEEEVLKESSHVSPSRQLRRYVERLRQIERNPKHSAKIRAAMASLGRMHQERAARLLAESQKHLKRIVEAYDNEMTEQVDEPAKGITISTSRSLKSITAPPPISEVLNEIYQEEPKAS